jgi:hypothetical protein
MERGDVGRHRNLGNQGEERDEQPHRPRMIAWPLPGE